MATARLVTEKFANPTRLGGVSNGGDVYLSGTVVSLDERAREKGCAARCKEDRRVVNTREVRTA